MVHHRRAEETRNAVDLADINNDDVLDIVATNVSMDVVIVAINNGDGSYTISTYPVGPNPCAIKASDLNRDELIDLVVADHSTNSIYVLLRNAQGSYEPLIQFETVVDNRP
ncbi:MAG: VCBS repeat-containing protein [Phycisphaerales bacterium]